MPLHLRMAECRFRIAHIKLWFKTAVEEGRPQLKWAVSAEVRRARVKPCRQCKRQRASCIGGVDTLPNSSETFPRRGSTCRPSGPSQAETPPAFFA